MPDRSLPLATAHPAKSSRPGAHLVDGSDNAYGRVFWLAYLANALAMIAISLLVRYADFVTHLGGAEGQLGLIVGVGMIGSLCMRAGQGVGIDKYGPRRIWLWSLVFFIGSLVAHLWITSSSGIAVFAVRILMQTSIAGIFGASITWISRRVRPERMAEIIGTLGTSGFFGILIGPQIADWICSGPVIERPQLDRLFLCAAGLGCVSFVAAWFATRGQPIPVVRRRASMVALVRRYHPGVVMLVAATIGAGVSIPNTFLRTYAAELGIAKIGLFFTVYAITAFVVRMSARRLFEKYGNRPWVICGLVLLATSMLLYLVVESMWQLVIPGVFAGSAHALLFPATVATGSTCFPERYRGLGTTLMLAMFDIGGLIGAPLIGGTLQYSRHLNLPAYPTTFVCAAIIISTVAGVFWFRTRAASATSMPVMYAPEKRSAAETSIVTAPLEPTVQPATSDL
jgi:MFS family permease